MPVRFQPFAAGGSGSDGSFTDAFIRANVGEGAGPNWVVNRQQSAVNVNLFDLTANTLRWANNAGVGTCQNYFYAIPGAAVFGQGSGVLQAGNHFSEATIAADNSVGGSLTRVGPSVSMAGVTNNGGAYWIENLPELLSFNLARVVNGTSTNLVDHSATPQYSTVVGLVLKLSVEYTSASITTVRSYCNGVLVDTFQDTNAARLTNGSPGMNGQFCSAGRFCTWSQYRCGPGI